MKNNTVYDDIPVSVKDVENATLSLFMKVKEEYKEAYAMMLLAVAEQAESKDKGFNSDTKLMLGKEIVDLIFAANTLLANIYHCKSDRDALFTMVYKKNKERGYYDVPETVNKSVPPEERNVTEEENRHDIPKYYVSGGEDVISFAHRCGVDKDIYLFNAMKYIVRAGKKENNAYEDDIKKAVNYLIRRLEQIEKK